MAGRARVVASDAKGRKAPRASRRQEEIRAKVYALQCIANLVRERLACLEHKPDGVSEMRLATGEVYLLGENALRRIA
jgi:hypothetical protein